MTSYKLSYKRFGERAILVEWPAIIDKNILNDVLHFKYKIKTHYNEYKVQITNAYNSLLVSYDLEFVDFDKRVDELKQLYDSKSNRGGSASKLWKIPVCYDDKFGIDLDGLSTTKGLSRDEMIQLHTEVVYTVYFIGFLPGFLYLGGLNERLHTPRKKTPRLDIEKGSVAIGGKQTGIYPSQSPGGWHIIGNSPINFFNVNNNPPCFAKAGDYIQFYSVTLNVYNDIKTLVEAGVYQLESEVIDD